MGDRSDHVVGLTRTSERTAHGNVYAPVWQVKSKYRELVLSPSAVLRIDSAEGSKMEA